MGEPGECRLPVCWALCRARAYGDGVRAGSPSGSSLADTTAQGTLTQLSWEVREEIRKGGSWQGSVRRCACASPARSWV